MQELKGYISAKGVLRGVVHIGEAGAERYKGSYTITPKVEPQTILTASKLMTDNLTVLGVPCYETSNETGTTVNIAVEA